MRTELKDVDGRDAAAFIQDILDTVDLTDQQFENLEIVCRDHDFKVCFWKDSHDESCVGPGD